MNVINIKLFYILFILFLFPINSFSDTPSDEELQQLEQLIKQQEVEQEKAKQRAAEEARRKAEEQKLKEERARLEEERRKLEEEKQAELIRRQQEEEKAKRLQEEQQRAAAEAEKTRQFEQYMSNAATAMNNHDYKSAQQAYTQALEIIPNDTNALQGQTKAREYQEFCTTLVGEWNWFLAKLVVHENGTVQALALIPNQGKWECTDPVKREFVLRWDVGGWIDTLTMTPDGNRVDVINNIGMQFYGTRIGSEPDSSAPEIKL